MTKILFAILLVIGISFQTRAQIGLAFHQTSAPFVGVNYQIGDQFLPEFRFISGDPEGEFVFNYIFLNNSVSQSYVGVGISSIQDLVVPVGMNFYPFDNKNFGFHMELSYLFASDWLRASWGIRYRFNKE